MTDSYYYEEIPLVTTNTEAADEEVEMEDEDSVGLSIFVYAYALAPVSTIVSAFITKSKWTDAQIATYESAARVYTDSEPHENWTTKYYNQNSTFYYSKVANYQLMLGGAQLVAWAGATFMGGGVFGKSLNAITKFSVPAYSYLLMTSSDF